MKIKAPTQLIKSIGYLSFVDGIYNNWVNQKKNVSTVNKIVEEKSANRNSIPSPY